VKYAALFLLLGASLTLLAVQFVISNAGSLTALIGTVLTGWTGIAFAAVGAAYAGLGPRVFGKRADGTLAWPNVLLLAPYLLLTLGLWHAQRLVSREDPANEIAPGLWLGRWPRRACELPPDTGLIVDLAMEFVAAQDLRRPDRHRTYFALPTLDASTPDPVAFDRAVRTVVETLPSTPVYVHCALGHGRSALLVAAVLLARGAAASAEEAEARVQAVRPGVALNKAQRRFLSDWWLGVGTKQHDNSSKEQQRA
jgi:hypothetical protein